MPFVFVSFIHIPVVLFCDPHLPQYLTDVAAMASSIPNEKPGEAPEVSSPDHGSETESRELDDNYKVFDGAHDLEVTPEEAKSVLRKIDLHVVPVLFGSYMLQYLDKNSLNFASVYGLQEGTHLHGQDYSWLGKCCVH